MNLTYALTITLQKFFLTKIAIRKFFLDFKKQFLIIIQLPMSMNTIGVRSKSVPTNAKPSAHAMTPLTFLISLFIKIFCSYAVKTALPNQCTSVKIST
jgi:hypothetical protein